MHDRPIACGEFLLLSFAVSSAASDVHCKMKPGCTFPTQCDPIPKEWSVTGHDVEKRLFNKEFPITCSINEIPEIQNSFQKEIEDLKLENGDLKVEIKVLEKIQEKNDKEIDELKIVIAALKNENKKSMETLNKTHKQLNAEIGSLMFKIDDSETKNKEFEDNLNGIEEKMNQEIDNLKIENKNLKNENKRSKVIQEKVNRVIADLKTENNELKFKNNDLEKTLNDIQKQVNQDEMEQHRQIQSLEVSLKHLSQRVVAISLQGCPIPFKNKCYVPKTDVKRNFAEAADICARMSGKLADIYDKVQFDYLLETIRRNHLNGENSIIFRTGMTFNTQTSQTKLSDGSPALYLRWNGGSPRRLTGWTNVLLQVKESPTIPSQYLHNYKSSQPYYTLCEI